MSAADVLSMICLIGVPVVAVIAAIDRNRLRQQLSNTEGRATGLSLDVGALRERVSQLGDYLNESSSWSVDAAPPAHLAATSPANRWTPRNAGQTAPVLPAAGGREPPTAPAASPTDSQRSSR